MAEDSPSWLVLVLVRLLSAVLMAVVALEVSAVGCRRCQLPVLPPCETPVEGSFIRGRQKQYGF